MKSSRFQFEYRKSSSKRHKLVGEILRNSPYFQTYIHYQEYPVERVSSDWDSGREHFDWVVPTLKLVIEVHGEQHYKPVRFGGISAEEATEAFKEQRIRDADKRNAALSAGWTYVAISPEVNITDEWILEQYRENYNTSKPLSKQKLSSWASNYKEAKAKYQQSDRYEEEKAKAAEYRKQQYRQKKEWKKQNV